jgi:phage head maturation protease
LADETETPEAVVPLSTEDIQLRSLDKRELDIRLMPWDTTIETATGLEEFKRGAFADANPDEIFLMGLEHEAHIGLGQGGQPVITRHPVGKATALDDRPDAQYGTFRVAKTARGDEVLALAAERIVTGASVEWAPVTGGSESRTHNGRRKTVHNRARLTGVSTTYRPAYATAGVVSVRSDHKEDAPVADDKAAAEATPNKEEPAEDRVQMRSMFDSLDSAFDKFAGTITDRLGKLEEAARSQFQVPGTPEKAKVTAGEWMQYTLRVLSGDRISSNDPQYRALEDVISSDNLGVVPDAFLQSEMIGVIDASRPFMSSTRRLPFPSSGLTMHVPLLEQRPTVGLQSEEKSEIDSTAIKVTTADFPAVTIAGGIDISIQLLKQSDPAFLDLALRLMAEAYAQTSERYALQNLLGSSVDDGNTLDPAAPGLGGAFETAFGEIRRPPDTIWLSSTAVGAFIDAVSPVTGLPMYSNITANATAGGGISGSVSGLRAVHVPELGDLGADVIVGPSSGFAWAESPQFVLQVDVPSRAGRDVAIVGIDFYAPYYPAAFTVYTLST